MSDYVRNKLVDIKTSPAYEPISKVILTVSDEVEYTAGNDTGRTLDVQCPWGTQAMANDILTAVTGYVYRPYAAETVYGASPLFELGDAVTIAGLYSVIASEDVTFCENYAANIAAPDSSEIEHEFPYQSKGQRAIDKKIAQAKASIKVALNSITLTAQDGSNQSTIEITGQGITTKSAIVKFTDIQADSIKADSDIFAPNIEGGTIKASDIYGSAIYAGVSDDGSYCKMERDSFDVYQNDQLKATIGMDGNDVEISLGATTPLKIRKFYDGKNKAWIGNNGETCGILLNFSDGTVQLVGDVVS